MRWRIVGRGAGRVVCRVTVVLTRYGSEQEPKIWWVQVRIDPPFLNIKEALSKVNYTT